VILAPLAPADYRLELTFDVSGEKQGVSYNFRIIP